MEQTHYMQSDYVCLAAKKMNIAQAYLQMSE